MTFLCPAAFSNARESGDIATVADARAQAINENNVVLQKPMKGEKHVEGVFNAGTKYTPTFFFFFLVHCIWALLTLEISVAT